MCFGVLHVCRWSYHCKVCLPSLLDLLATLINGYMYFFTCGQSCGTYVGLVVGPAAVYAMVLAWVASQVLARAAGSKEC
jgi:hypothetical protein